MVFCLLEQRQRLSCQLLERVDGAALEPHAEGGGADLGEQLARGVAGCASSFGGGVGDRDGLRTVPTDEQRGEVELEHDVEPHGPDQLERPFQQPGSGPVVASPERAATCDGEPVAGPFGQGRVGLAKLVLVAGGLFEVVAEDLVQFDELLAALLEPGAEALVQVSAGRLPQGVVGRVADQEVAEAEAVLASELRRLRRA